MSDLRKAAQQALEALELASRNGSDGLKRYELKQLDETITALRAALAQPEPEPVAWACFKDGELRVELIDDDEESVDYWIASDEPEMQGMVKRPIYAHPPQRKPLTDEIEEIINDNTDGDGVCCADDLLAAIRAHEIGG